MVRSFNVFFDLFLNIASSLCKERGWCHHPLHKKIATAPGCSSQRTSRSCARWRHEMETFSALLVLFWRDIHRSPVNSPHKGQWRGALMYSLICAWTNCWVSNQDAGDLRRHRAQYDVTVMWCRIVIQWYRQPWDLAPFNASLLSNFELVKRVKLKGSVHYGRNGLKLGTLLYPDYNSLKLTISFELGRK